jgi:fructose-1,6-bisphosphatase/inositol monophosphatase family enzyme
MTPATSVASRTDRRPVAGGLYDPRVNRTFIAWGGKYQDSYVQAYDHASGTWTAPQKP